MRLEGSETQCLMVAGDRCQTSSLARRASLGFPVCGYRKAMDSVAGANRVGRALSIWACSPSLDSVARAGKVEKIFHSRPTSCLLYAFCDHRWSDPWPRQSFRLRLRCSSSHPAGCGPCALLRRGWAASMCLSSIVSLSLLLRVAVPIVPGSFRLISLASVLQHTVLPSSLHFSST